MTARYWWMYAAVLFSMEKEKTVAGIFVNYLSVLSLQQVDDKWRCKQIKPIK